MEQFSGISRPLDFSYASNRFIAGVVLAAIPLHGIAKLLQGWHWLDALLWSLQVALAVFLAWALSREIDPDHNQSAAISALFILFSLFVFQLPSFGLIFWLLLSMRVLNKTTGILPTWLDLAGYVGFSFFLTLNNHPLMLAAGAAVLSLNAFLFERHQPSFFAAAAAAVIFVALILLDQTYIPPPDQNLSALSLLGILFAASITLPVVFQSSRIDSRCDYTDQKVTPRRLQTAQLLVFLFLCFQLLMNGFSGLLLVLPAAAALFSATIYIFFKWSIR